MKNNAFPAMARHFPTALFCLVLSLISQLAANTSGPDSYGYTWKDRGESDGPSFLWIDITTTGTKVVSSGDNTSSNSSSPTGIGEPVQLGHPFTFYGVTYDALVPTANGYLSTDTGESGADTSFDCPLPARPSHGRGARIYANHKDWQITAGGGIYYQYFRESPHPHAGCGVSVFSWVGVLPSGSSSGIASTFQVLLFDSGDILVQNLLILGSQIGDNETVGIQNASASSGIAYGCPTPLPNNADAQAILFELEAAAVSLAQPGAKVVMDSGSKVVNQTITYDEPITIIGSDFVNPLVGTLRYGISYEGCTIIIDGALVNIFDAHIRDAPDVAIRVINGGHLHLCNSSILGAGTHSIVVEEGSKLTMRRTDVSDSRPRSSTHIVLGKAAVAKIYKSVIAEGWQDGIDFNTVTTSSEPTLLIEQSSIVRNRGNGINLNGATFRLLQSNITDNLGVGLLAKNSNLKTHSSNITSNLSGGMSLLGSTLNTDHCIIAQNRSAVTGFVENFLLQSSNVISGGSNLTDGAATFLNASGDLTETDPKLTPLGGYGERIGAASPRPITPLMTQLALHNSPVIDASSTSPVSDLPDVDLRGQARIRNGDNAGASILDIGSTEAASFITVTTSADQNDSPPGASVSLREALLAATNGERIVFAAGLNGQTINLASSAGGQGSGLGAANFNSLVDASSLPNGITVSGGGELNVPLLSGPRLVHGLTLTQGLWSAVRNFSGVLVMSSCRIVNNSQQGSTINQPYGTWGGGIFNGDIAFITDCTFENNYCSNGDDQFAVGGGYGAFPSAGTGLVTGAGVNYVIRSRFISNNADFHSGGLIVRSGVRTIVDSCSFIDNRASGNAGATLVASSLDRTYLDLTRSSFIRNVALQGGIAGLNISGVLEVGDDIIVERGSISYCTFDNNLVGAGNFGAISAAGIELEMEHCTITNNQAEQHGGLTIGAHATVNMRNTIIDNNLAGFNGQYATSNLTLVNGGVFNSLGNNLTGDNLTNFDHASDITNSPPLLAPITQSTVAVPTRHPLHGSPAIDGGAGNGFAIDARGYPGRQGSRVDIGAVESGLPVVVNTVVDEFNTPSGTNVSLREALRDAREGSRIIFSAAHIGPSALIDLRTTATGQGVDLETEKNLVVDATMIDGGVTIYAPSGDRCLTLPDGAQTFSLHGFSFRNGEAGTNGSAIHKGLQTDLTITHSAIYNSISTNNAAAVHANGGTLTLENVTLSGNSSTQGGSAVSGRNGANISLRHTTISDNTISTNNFPGGAAIFLEANASLECDHVAMGGNVYNPNFSLRNLLRFLPANTTVGDVFRTIIDDNSVPGATQVGSLFLYPIQDAGGLALTCPPQAGSPIVNAGAPIYIGTPATDARGFARKYGPRVDVGAYELGSFIPGTTDPPIDIGNNGMDDFWEEFYGFIPNHPSNATSDNDSDGLSALGEYLSQTNPGVFDPIEPLKIVGFQYFPSTGQVWLTFSSSPGIAYSVWHSPDLGPAGFGKILDVFGASSGNQTQIILEPSTFGGGTEGFFRVHKP